MDFSHMDRLSLISSRFISVCLSSSDIHGLSTVSCSGSVHFSEFDFQTDTDAESESESESESDIESDIESEIESDTDGEPAEESPIAGGVNRNLHKIHLKSTK
ncbi:Neuroendocrine-specific golgi protein P55 (NESP55) [Anoxynatronum buryatiense]|uniref:Neuroendocrine-specific golgi protein P55 (NESP55) n=1 Tax=Anoxynatronum buryatiense TaxID=489973 RepID=A0AA46AJX8_9CLOT|nr:Neuroendocrine-specific golgi protein P55 (NESP55) [Anoxynatronum buryatiense]